MIFKQFLWDVGTLEGRLMQVLVQDKNLIYTQARVANSIFPSFFHLGSIQPFAPQSRLLEHYVLLCLFYLNLEFCYLCLKDPPSLVISNPIYRCLHICSHLFCSHRLQNLSIQMFFDVSIKAIKKENKNLDRQKNHRVNVITNHLYYKAHPILKIQTYKGH